MKKAFTMIELVFVIVIVGIISVMIAPSFGGNNLRQAADQLVSHIRYTQHLAMMDNKFSTTDSNWFLGRWQIRFSQANSSESYFIMSDTITSSYDANPNAPIGFSYSEVAQDPANPEIYLIGTEYSSFDNDSREHINPKLDLLSEYGITSINISGGSTGSTSRRVIFDNIGRPYRGDTKLSNPNTISSPTDRIAQTQITITISDGVENEVIAIEPETGYTHIL